MFLYTFNTVFSVSYILSLSVSPFPLHIFTLASPKCSVSVSKPQSKLQWRLYLLPSLLLLFISFSSYFCLSVCLIEGQKAISYEASAVKTFDISPGLKRRRELFSCNLRLQYLGTQKGDLQSPSKHITALSVIYLNGIKGHQASVIYLSRMRK